MSDGRKKRLSMLDQIAQAGAAPAPVTTSSAGSLNRAMRAARTAVDTHRIWDLDPDRIIDDRIADRIAVTDLAHLQAQIETNGQTVPILVRRHPTQPDHYLLVYGRRRLEAIRASDTVHTVRALIADMDDRSAITAQVAENTARQDLSYIEKALFAHDLVAQGFGTQKDVAEVLCATKSSVSMAIGVVQTLGRALIEAIGPAHGIGRPRWDRMVKAIEALGIDPDTLAGIAASAEAEALMNPAHDAAGDRIDPSEAAFAAVMADLEARQPRKAATRKTADVRELRIAGGPKGRLRETGAGLRMEIGKGGFADWLAGELPDVLNDLHARYLRARDHG